MKRIVVGIVLLMFLAGTLFAAGCGPKKDENIDLTKPPPDKAQEG